MNIEQKLTQIPHTPSFKTFELNTEFQNDTSENKVNGTIGLYRKEGQPFVMNIVQKVEQELAAVKNPNKEYLDFRGYKGFCEEAQKLLFDITQPSLKNIATIQTFSGIGALRIGLEFIKKYFTNKVYVSEPTWSFYNGLIEVLNMEIKHYIYYDRDNNLLNFEGLIKDLQNAEPNSCILLQCSSHNPTGMDPTPEQWQKIGQTIKEKSLIAFLDSAYLSYGSGDIEQDAYPIKVFQELGIMYLVAQCFGKCFCLFGELVGALHIMCSNEVTKNNVQSQLESIYIFVQLIVFSRMFSTFFTGGPVIHGAEVITTILQNPDYKQQWKNELKQVTDNLKQLRLQMYNELIAEGVKGQWDYIMKEQGLYIYFNFNAEEIEKLKNDYHFYLLDNGRFCLGGIKSSDIQKIVQSLKNLLN